MADAALSRARARGATHAEFRFSQRRRLDIRVRDARLEGSDDHLDSGYGVRVIADGSRGFAAGTTPTPDAAMRATDSACAIARDLRHLTEAPVELVDEPCHGEVGWASAYQRDPMTVPAAERVDLLRQWCRQLLSSGQVDHASARVIAVRQDTFYADTAGTMATQRVVWLHPMVTAVRVDRSRGRFATLRSVGPPTARGWEYLTGTGWDWTAELSAMPDQLTELSTAPPVRPGRYDLVIDPTNLWLTIHETIGHATELDRALGYEAGFAGTTFATVDRLGELRYGSPALNVTGDRTTRHGLATVGLDDEGVAAQSWDLIRDGVLVGYQADRHTAREAGMTRSNGCASADSYYRPPLPRMANVSVVPDRGGPDTAGLIAGVSDGLYLVGDKGWSIDMQRLNFQFTSQRCYRIRHGRLAGQVTGAAYAGTTPEFWRSLEAVGGPRTQLLAGASACGKGQPLQLSGASHGCPSVLVRDIQVLDTGAL